MMLSFIVSIIGTTLTLGVFGPLFGPQDQSAGPILFNKPGILERITEKVTEKETIEKIFREDELVVQVVERVSPAVVSIVATKDVPVVERYFVDPFGDDPFFRDFFGDGSSGFQIPQYREKGTQKREISSGSGFLVSEDGFVITNKHVVADTEAEYTVLLNDGRKIAAEVRARDPLQDLAVLKIEGNNFPFATLGDSAGIKIGQTVIAIGNALGEFRNTVSVGVVSGLQRTIVAGGGGGSELLQELIQTDAAINPGNSGGPLLDIRGEVIGINTAVARGAENIGFSIPVNKAKRGLESVEKHGRIIYPFLGVRYITITPDLAKSRGLLREYGALLEGSGSDPAVSPGSPAHKAGLREGDIILELDGERVDFDHSLASLIQKHDVGDDVVLKIFRIPDGQDGKEFEVTVVLAERK